MLSGTSIAGSVCHHTCEACSAQQAFSNLQRPSRAHVLCEVPQIASTCTNTAATVAERQRRTVSCILQRRHVRIAKRQRRTVSCILKRSQPLPPRLIPTYRFPPCTAHRLRAPAVETGSQTFCCYGYASMEAAEGRHQVPTKARAVPVAAVSKCTFRACVAFGLQRGFESRSAVQCLKLMNLRRSYVPYKFFRPKC